MDGSAQIDDRHGHDLEDLSLGMTATYARTVGGTTVLKGETRIMVRCRADRQSVAA